jgi:hypothetical protein
MPEGLKDEVDFLRFVFGLLGLDQKGPARTNRMALARVTRGELSAAKLEETHADLMNGVFRYFRSTENAGSGAANGWAMVGPKQA